MDDKNLAEDCYRRLYRGMMEKDETILEEVLHPSFVLRHMTGMHQTKEEFIRAVQDGTLNYRSADHQNIKVTLQRNQAELTGQSVVRAAVFGGGWNTWRLQLKCRLSSENGKWQITEAAASTY